MLKKQLHNQSKIDAISQLKHLSFAITLLFALLSSLSFWNHQRDIHQLQTIAGDLIKYRRANVVADKKSTLITLDIYPSKEFNLGETLLPSKLSQALNDTGQINKIELMVPSRVLLTARSIIPAFYGIKVNGQIIRSTGESVKNRKDDKKYLILPTILFGITTIVAKRYEIKLSK